MNTPIHIENISDLSRLFGPGLALHHPLAAVIDFSQINPHVADGTRVSSEFYTLIFKHYNRTNIKYGRKVIDFNEGSLICMAPQQILEIDQDNEQATTRRGWGLFFHPDLFRHAALKKYSFFAYEVSEALHLSDKEKQVLAECVDKLAQELEENIDVHSQAIIVSGIELLLNYCTRFYGRQFITRKSTNNSIVAQVEKVLYNYFNDDRKTGLPTVKYLADQVNLSPNYLSDLLKKETGKNTQDHIHYQVIEAAKNSLLNTDRSIGEIAYALGFEYPQYFNKLFKQKTGKTPLEFRNLN